MNLKENIFCFFPQYAVNLLCNFYAIQSADRGRRKCETLTVAVHSIQFPFLKERSI
jgi:hypothetical protein